MDRRKNRPNPVICACGDHAWVPLTRGFVTLVDVADIHHLSGVCWSTGIRKSGQVYAHRTARKRHHSLHGDITGYLLTDHVDRNSLDNRRCNLRPATKSQNGANSRGKTARLHPFKGVDKREHGYTWKARIAVRGKPLYLGNFPTAEDAARAYDRAASVHFGVYACLNFPRGGQ